MEKNNKFKFNEMNNDNMSPNELETERINLENEDLDQLFEPQCFKEVAEIAEQQLFMSPRQIIMRRFLQNKLAVIGLCILVFMFIFCFIFPIFYPYSETELFYIHRETGERLRGYQTDLIGDSLLARLQPMSSQNLLGTNEMGQDMLARLMYGGRVSLLVSMTVIFACLLIGITLGGLAGYFGGIIDMIVMRLCDIVASIPFIPLMFIVSSLMLVMSISPENKIFYTMIAIALLWWTMDARIVRGNLLYLRESEYMQAAKATGIKSRNQIFRHLLPNTLPSIIVNSTLNLGGVILLESVLSFLGVGVGIPFASWGNMVQSVNSNEVMRFHPHVWIAPGLCILLVVLAFNFVGDGLRDATDPKARR